MNKIITDIMQDARIKEIVYLGDNSFELYIDENDSDEYINDLEIHLEDVAIEINNGLCYSIIISL